MGRGKWAANRWSDRSREFGAVRAIADRDGRMVPTTEYFPADGVRGAHLRNLWLELPPHPTLLDAVRTIADSDLRLRYPAVHWQSPADLEPSGLANIGARLADLYRSAVRAIPEVDVFRLARPFVLIDLVGHVRVGFKPVEHWTVDLAPEMKKPWPRCDPRALVYAIGRLLEDHYRVDDRAIRAVIARCHHRKPDKRYQSLDEAFDAFQRLAEVEPTRPDELHAWRQLEEGLGWLELDDTARAIEHFEDALAHASYEDIALSGLEAARARIREAIATAASSSPPRPPPRPPAPARPGWTVVEPEGSRREASRDFAGALALYDSVAPGDQANAALLGARARVYLELGNPASAIECASRAVAADRAAIGAHVVLAKALLAGGRHAEALAETDLLVARSATDATYHYLRGKALFALARLHEARDAFDLACSLPPVLIEAMLLRREVDRCLVVGQRAVGSQGPIAFDIPASVAELRDVLIGGRTSDAIAALSKPHLADDPDAQLVLARMLAFDRQIERAAETYDRVAAMPEPHRHRALVGKATLLLDRDDLESALVGFELVCAERPSDPDAAEGRARPRTPRSHRRGGRRVPPLRRAGDLAIGRPRANRAALARRARVASAAAIRDTEPDREVIATAALAFDEHAESMVRVRDHVEPDRHAEAKAAGVPVTVDGEIGPLLAGPGAAPAVGLAHLRALGVPADPRGDPEDVDLEQQGARQVERHHGVDRGVRGLHAEALQRVALPGPDEADAERQPVVQANATHDLDRSSLPRRGGEVLIGVWPRQIAPVAPADAGLHHEP